MSNFLIHFWKLKRILVNYYGGPDFSCICEKQHIWSISDLLVRTRYCANQMSENHRDGAFNTPKSFSIKRTSSVRISSLIGSEIPAGICAKYTFCERQHTMQKYTSACPILLQFHKPLNVIISETAYLFCTAKSPTLPKISNYSCRLLFSCLLYTLFNHFKAFFHSLFIFFASRFDY